VEPPEPPAILVGDRVHDRLVELVVTARVTVAAKPFSGETLIDNPPRKPMGGLTLVALPVIAKSCARNSTLAAAEWKIGPVPVTVAR
jgi:hypothetical protein